MINDKQLLKLWDNKENSDKEYWEFNNLTGKEKIRIFDLVQKRSVGMKIFCCGKEITEVEEGVNGSDFYMCENCGKTYNIIRGQEKE